MIEGRRYGVKIGVANATNGEFVRCELSSTLTINIEYVNKSGSHSPNSKHYRYGYYSWSLEVNARDLMKTLIEAQTTGDEVEVFITNRVSNTEEIHLWGTVGISNITMSMPLTGYANTTVTLQGVGDLYGDFNNIFDIINAMPYDADKDLVITTYIE